MQATSSPQWSDATLQTWLGLAHWQEYANLLNIINSYQMQQITVTQDSNGQFAISSLSTGSGDSAKNFYRILALAQPSTAGGEFQFFYQQTQFKMYPNPQPQTAMPYVWYQFGRYIQVLPVQSGVSLTCTVNWRPPRVDQLSSDSVAVDFPDGYESLLAWRAAGLALRKGGEEPQAAMLMDNTAKAIREEMLLDLGRVGTTPIIAGAFDDISDWASS
jgi:hypothetical protein